MTSPLEHGTETMAKLEELDLQDIIPALESRGLLV